MFVFTNLSSRSSHSVRCNRIFNFIPHFTSSHLYIHFICLLTADIYAFLVVFVLPLNSAVNPLLYTFTTPKYRNQVLLRGWNKLTSRKLTRNDGSGHTGSGSNHGIVFFLSLYSNRKRILSSHDVSFSKIISALQ